MNSPPTPDELAADITHPEVDELAVGSLSRSPPGFFGGSVAVSGGNEQKQK
ncbi:hypothetical protein HanRHA438_Chr03g0104311 [Helianthus annuus]|uniref:Uncharacterized protein n=1 Tax=Helianthus annuus TaxID=4232 RepID=A0A9K3JCG2_HELAN|nr:hypothetical protein HanXRQr2_Chr03g0093221 [Helianthus annuus]KAJ0934160.1 hypothetical protein HanRHA438_Chr03g0104311 [Helianthus annuus]